MRIQFMSDAHLEFEHFPEDRLVLHDVARDVLVLAGDIGIGDEALPFVLDQLEESPVVMVAGNHEFYGQDMDSIRDFWRGVDVRTEGFHYLDDSYVILRDTYASQDVMFVGGTLWTDMNKEDPLFMLDVREGMSDYFTIRLGAEEFTPEAAVQLHKKTRGYIDQMLSSRGDMKTVVVTHHAPSTLSVSKRYNPNMCWAYVSDLSDLILTRKPDVWIHGHIHEARDYMIGNTRIVSNPRGYIRHHRGYNELFDPGRTIHV